jgi:hypothetical protein
MQQLAKLPSGPQAGNDIKDLATRVSNLNKQIQSDNRPSAQQVRTLARDLGNVGEQNGETNANDGQG